MSKIRVLLVDDEGDYVTALADRMDLRDLQSQTATSGEEALLTLKTSPPNVIVLDLWMPGLGGLAVLEEVKKLHPSMEVIILTGHGSDQEEMEARRLGAFAYFRKPVDINELVQAVRRAGEATHGARV